MSVETDNPITKTAYFEAAREAHSFGQALGFVACLTGLAVTVWFLGASFLGWSPIPASMTRFAVFVIVGYYLFTGLRALIAYTLTTAIRLFFEGVAMTCTTMAQSLGERPAPIGQDGNVTFLKDVLAATGRSPFGKDVDA